ncbi:hypothetical protein JTE90_029141 [Oedothorax gibbosus]|uniref:Methyltransferase type 11 domain-containing protein n=1 Tax=Oedothorax gibbosus TaxID=931172 RepID=A0AAV6UK63_9ARAC|nr:hypothetical protein JTE90_029141 [Oedothorax gibbosus]
MSSALFAAKSHAQLYAKFRPFPPDLLVKSIITYLSKKVPAPFKNAVDIGCGSGQSSFVLSPYFESITGFDVSEAQIKYAQEQHSAPNITYKVSSGNCWSIASASVQLVTFAQSFHWFDSEEAFREVERILIPNGVIAVYGYSIPIPRVDDQTKNAKLKELIEKYLHTEKLGDYWRKENLVVERAYADITLPFQDTCRENFVMEAQSSLSEYLGYLKTWSSFQKLYKEDCQKANNLLQDVKNRFLEILDKTKCQEEICFTLHTDYFMLLGRK